MSVLYIDASHHDRNRRGGPLDWAKIRAATSPVMCARLTYGDPSGYHWPTPYAAEHHAGARAAGFVARGGYHNLISGDQACINRQVDWIRRELDAVGAGWAMCDVEPYAELVTAGRWPRWDDVRRFHDRWYALEQRVCAWYIPRWFWVKDVANVGLGRPDLRGLRGPLVQSHYAGGDGTAAQIYAAAGGDAGTGWDDAFGARLPDIWQYTSSANVPGATDRTDVNAWRGSLPQLVDLLNGDDMTPEELKRMPLAGDDYHPTRTFDEWADDLYDGVHRRMTREFAAFHAKLDAIASKVDLDASELAAVADAARQGAEAGAVASVDELAAALGPLLQPGVTVEQIRQLLASVRLTPGA